MTGIKDAAADRNVLVIEYLTALERIGDGRATKLVIPASSRASSASSAPSVPPPSRTPTPMNYVLVGGYHPGCGLARRRRTADRRVMKMSEAPTRAGIPIRKAVLACAGGTAPTGPVATGRGQHPPSCNGVPSRDGPRGIGGPGPGQSRVVRPEVDEIVAQVRQVARSEVDRAAEVFARRATAATRELQPLVTEYTNRLLRWVRSRPSSWPPPSSDGSCSRRSLRSRSSIGSVTESTASAIDGPRPAVPTGRRGRLAAGVLGWGQGWRGVVTRGCVSDPERLRAQSGP